MSKKLKVGIIGLGRIGFNLRFDVLREKPCTHYGAYEHNPDCEIVSVCDISVANLPYIFKSIPLPTQPLFYASYEKMMKETELDIVSVCTPTETHADIVVNVAKYKPKIIFCEKPIATNLEDAGNMIYACEVNGVKLAINHLRRWHPLFQRARSEVDKGTIGRLLFLIGFFSGDPLNDGIHMADLANWFGVKPIASRPLKTDYLIFEVDLIGTKGRIRITDNGRWLEIQTPGKSAHYKGYQELIHEEEIRYDDFPDHNPWVRAVKDLVRAIEQEMTPLCTGMEGYNALKLCLEWMKK
jgi:predicted dehydrogenase